MSIEDNFQAFLAASAAVTATVASGPVAIAPVTASEGLAFPRIVFWKSNDAPVYYSGGVAGLNRADLTVECQSRGATAIADAEATRDAVKTLLSGIGNSTTMGANKVSRCFITNDYDVPYAAVHGEEIGVRAKALDLELDYV